MTIGRTTQARARIQPRGNCVEALADLDTSERQRLQHSVALAAGLAPPKQGTTPTVRAAEVGQSLAGLRLGESQTYLNLTLFPLIGEGEAASGYLLLDEALDRQLVRVTEVSKDGSIPEIA